jgi:hypothetical protein
MFCPKCKTEYREGFTQCADCNVPLVDELPPASEHVEYIDLVEVLNTNDQSVIALAKAGLEKQNIHYVAQGEHSLIGGGAYYVRFLVPRKKEKLAKKILKNFL